ncbi:type I polyketide synthase [Polymorphospora rubra]|uniref:type I polyketide synthase n=1 Tax=Polymorphospora rubra TaxID=338584 RepID=UPI0033ECA798
MTERSEGMDRRIAVVGMAFRLPGADNPQTYWRNIRDGVCSVRRFGDRELAAAGVPAQLRAAPDFVGVSGVLDDIEGFDAEFFGISAHEARVTDPQHRIFLETCYHALEHGGYAATAPDTRVGVFAGVGFHLYPLNTYLMSNLAHPDRDDDWLSGMQVAVGNYADFLATRASYRLGLTGPSMGVQSGCSTSLVAVHLASQALLAGDADLAVAGAAAVHVPVALGYRYVKGSILSRSGRCRAFDAEADGTVGGNGVAAVLLKRFDRAVADGDTIHAVLLGAGINNDGAGKHSYTAPSAAGQRGALLRAYEVAGVSPDQIGYLETHGTGTYKGDPIEFDGMTSAFRKHTDRVGYCAIGSVKPNIGHLDACAGMAGLIKTILVLRHGEIPPMAGYRRPNPALALDSSPFYIPTAPRPWPAGAGPRRAAVTALGVGGTNVHLVLEEAPPRRVPAGDAAVPGLLPLSARHPDALVRLATAMRDQLRADPDAAPADLLTTTALGRPHLRHRLVAFGDTPAALADALDAYLGRPDRPDPRFVAGAEPRPAPVFLYSGQGTPTPGMARVLYERFPAFRAVLDECERLHTDAGGRSLLAALTDPATPDTIWDTEFAQPALFAYQAALTGLWHALGIAPGLVAGHSVGEYAALHAAGALSLADGIRLTRRRGELMHRSTAPGGMLAVLAGPETVDRLRAECPDLDLAAVNTATNRVLAGPAAAVDWAGALLDGWGVRRQRLAVDRAFHSALLDPVLPDLRRLLASVPFQPLRIPLVSGVDGAVLPAGHVVDVDYLLRHARQPVRFDLVLETVGRTADAPLVEVGPNAVLAGLGRAVLPDRPVVVTQRRNAELDTLGRAVARLHAAGAAVDWSVLLAGGGGGRVPLPAYPFQHRPHWISPVGGTTPPAPPAPPADPPAVAHDEGTLRAVEAVAEQVRGLAAVQARLLGQLAEVVARRPATEPGPPAPATDLADSSSVSGA